MPDYPDRDTTIITPGTIVFPTKKFTIFFRIIITDQNGVDYDVSFDCLSCQINRAATDMISSCTFELNNMDSKYNSLFFGQETVRVYLDYVDGTTLQFRGKIDSMFNRLSVDGWTLSFHCRDSPIMADESVNFTFNNVDIKACIIGQSGFVDANGNFQDGLLYKTGITYDPLNSLPSLTINLVYGEKTRWEILKNLIALIDYDCYVTVQGNLRIFQKQSITNSNEYVVFGDNFISLEEYGADLLDLKNKIQVYGVVYKENILFTRTAQDDNSIALYGLRKITLTDNSLTTVDALDQLAISTLQQRGTALKKGTITSTGLESIQPGEQLAVSIAGIIEGLARVPIFSHTFSPGSGWITQLTVEQELPNLGLQFKSQKDATKDSIPYSNPFNLVQTIYLNTFDNNSGIILTGCAVQNGFLVNTGTMTTTLIQQNFDWYIVQLSVVGSNVSANTYQISNDGGTTFASIIPGVTMTMPTVGRQFVMKVNNTPSSQIDTLSVTVR